MKLSVDVHNFLQNKDIQHEIFLLDEPTKSAQQAAALLGLKSSEIVKSIILLISDKPINAIVPGNKHVSFKKLKSLFGDVSIKMAASKEACDMTGYVLGATPPIAHHDNIKTLIDKDCMDKNVLYTGGGELNAMLKIRPQDLKNAADAKVADISE